MRAPSQPSTSRRRTGAPAMTSHRRHDDRGFSLAEALVASLIFLVVATESLI